MHVCCINNTSRGSMRCFPKVEGVRQKWTNFIRRYQKDYILPKKSALHFIQFQDGCWLQFPLSEYQEKIAKKPLLKSKLIMDYRFPTEQDCSTIISVDFSLV